MKKTIRIIAFLFAVFMPITSAQNIPNLPIPICSGTAEVISDSIFFFGGANRWAGTIRYPVVYKYDGTSWSLHDSIPDDNVWGMESVVAGNNIYLFAGWPSGGRFVRKYDVINKNWNYLNQSPNTVNYGISVEYVNNHIYLFNTTGSVYEYDLANDTWQAKTPNSTPGYSLSSVAYQDEIYILGFYDSTFYKYTPVTDVWTQLAYPPYKITRCAMEVINDKIYCVGGSPEGNVAPVRTMLGYEVLSDRWTIDEFAIVDERVWMAEVMYNNRFIVLGGFDSTGFAVDIVEEIVPIGPITGLSEQPEQPIEYLLNQNFPNPFNPSTKIKFTIPFVIATPQGRGKQSQLVSLKVYDVLGNEIATLVDEEKTGGNYEIEFIAADLPSGIYFYKLMTSNFAETKKMILLR